MYICVFTYIYKYILCMHMYIMSVFSLKQCVKRNMLGLHTFVDMYI